MEALMVARAVEVAVHLLFRAKEVMEKLGSERRSEEPEIRMVRMHSLSLKGTSNSPESQSSSTRELSMTPRC